MRLPQLREVPVKFRNLVPREEARFSLTDSELSLDILRHVARKLSGLSAAHDNPLNSVEVLRAEAADELDVVGDKAFDLLGQPRLEAGILSAEQFLEGPVDIVQVELASRPGHFRGEVAVEGLGILLKELSPGQIQYLAHGIVIGVLAVGGHFRARQFGLGDDRVDIGDHLLVDDPVQALDDLS